MRHLPEDVQELIGEPMLRVRGISVYGDDAFSVEMAADEICAALCDHPKAEEAFRGWFVTRYPIYA
jgi:hypothetical protein